MARKKPHRPSDPREARAGTVALNWFKIDEALRERGLRWTSEKDRCLVSRATWFRLKHKKRISPAKALQVAEFLHFELSELLVPDDDQEPVFGWPEHPEWEIVEGSIPWDHTSNGLYFYRCKVKHKHIGDKKTLEFGRARVYDLTRVPDKKRNQMRELLTRHALVCRQLARSPQFISNLSVAPVAGERIWWVVDEWIEGRKLTEVMCSGAVETVLLNDMMRQVAEGLRILHQQRIIVRELSPNRLFIDAAHQVRFVELDLAKLLFGDKTVSAEWHDDNYRAPEVEGGNATAKADLFSWAMIYLHAATADLTLTWRDVDAIDQFNPSSELKGVLKKCLSPTPRARPRSADQLLKALQS